jgi:hypothetical protein
VSRSALEPYIEDIMNELKVTFCNYFINILLIYLTVRPQLSERLDPLKKLRSDPLSCAAPWRKRRWTGRP